MRQNLSEPTTLRIRWPARLAAAIAILLPALFAAAVILEHRVDVPLWDDWERGPLLQKWHEGTLTFQDLYAPHIQHRMVVPRLVNLASNALTQGNLRAELGVNFAVIILTAIGAAFLAWRSLAPRPCAPFVAFLVSAVLCSPIQFQNYLWLTTLGIALPALCLVLAIVAWQSRWHTGIRFGICVALALIGTHSFGHGIVLWPCILVLIAAGEGTLKQRIRLGLLWVLLGGATAAAYFHNLENTAHPTHAYFGQSEKAAHHTLETLRTDPARLLFFFARVLGSPLCRAPHTSPLETGLAIGFAILLLCAVAKILWIVRWTDADLRRRALPWLVLAFYGVACAAAVTWGRGGWETANRALTPRYVTMAQHAAASLLVLIPLLSGARLAQRIAPAGWIVGGFFAGWMLLQWIQGARLAEAWAWGRIQAKAQLVVLPVARPTTLKLIDAELGFIRTQMNFLAERGFLNPPPLNEPWLDRFPVATRSIPQGKAGLDPVRIDSGNFVVSGTAFTPGTGRPADAVLLCENVAGRWKIRYIADPELPQGEPRFNLDYEFTSLHLAGGYKPLPRWEKRIPLREAPAPGSEWSAWILDGVKFRVTRIPGEIRFPEATAR